MINVQKSENRSQSRLPIFTLPRKNCPTLAQKSEGEAQRLTPKRPALQPRSAEARASQPEAPRSSLLEFAAFFQIFPIF
ncbi:hypothetical protein ACS0TY_017515 [Phlomoides rotata]